MPRPRRIGETAYAIAAEDDDRQHADRAIDQRDRERLGLRHAVDQRQDADHAGLDDADPGRREGHGRQQRARQGHEERAADAELDVREAEGQDDQVQAQSPRSPR